VWRAFIEQPTVVAVGILTPATVGVVAGLVGQYRQLVVGEDDLALLGVGVTVHGMPA
jgi:hypothetical protein